MNINFKDSFTEKLYLKVCLSHFLILFFLFHISYLSQIKTRHNRSIQMVITPSLHISWILLIDIDGI